MNLPRNTEPQANGALARALMKRHPLWDDTSVHAERTRVLQGSSGLQVDILIHTPARQPVAIETEFAPAATVENEATQRPRMEVGIYRRDHRERDLRRASGSTDDRFAGHY